MAKQRARVAVRKAVERATVAAREQQRSVYEPNVIAEGVRAVAVHLEPIVTPGALYWAAPFRFVIEQMAPRVCGHYGLPAERAQDVGEYLLAAFNDFVVSIVEGFDREHFEAWITAQSRQDVTEGGASGIG